MGWVWLILYALGVVVAFYAVAALTIFCLARFGRGSRDETHGGENRLYAPSRPDPPPFAAWRDRPVTEADVWIAARVMVDQHGAAAAIHAERNAELAADERDREVWLRIKREIAKGEIEPREAGVVPGHW